MKKVFLMSTIIVSALSANATEDDFQIVGGRASIFGTNFVAPTINGKSNIYDPTAGEIIYDSSDASFYGRTHSSAWVPLGGASNIIPTGTILTFAASSCPTGYLSTNGSTVSRTTYADLFAIIGVTHGSGDGSTTFTLPDYRGRFLRGIDGAAGRDPNSSTRTAMSTGGNTGNNVGSVQADAFQGHEHNSWWLQASSSGAVGSYIAGRDGGGGGSYQATSSIVNDASYGTARPASETRPINAYVNYCIKY